MNRIDMPNVGRFARRPRKAYSAPPNGSPAQSLLDHITKPALPLRMSVTPHARDSHAKQIGTAHLLRLPSKQIISTSGKYHESRNIFPIIFTKLRYLN